MESYLAIKRNEIIPFVATWIEQEIIILSEVSQKEKDKYDIIYMWNLKYDTNDLIYETDFLTFFSIMVYHRILNIVPCAIQ